MKYAESKGKGAGSGVVHKLCTTEIAFRGGAIAQRTKEEIETETGIPIISPDNFLYLTEQKKKKLQLQNKRPDEHS